MYMYMYIYMYMYHIFLIQLVATAQGRILSNAFISFDTCSVLPTSTEGPFDIHRTDTEG